MKNQTYVERVVEKAKKAINENLPESSEGKLQTIREAAIESAERQNHSLQGEIYKAKDAVKTCKARVESLKSAEVLDFGQIKAAVIASKVAESDLKFLTELQNELFPTVESNE